MSISSFERPMSEWTSGLGVYVQEREEGYVGGDGGCSGGGSSGKGR